MPLSQSDRSFLKQVYKDLADEPLPPDSPFYEPVYEVLGLDDPVQQISTLIDFAGVESIRLFSGFRGSGKTTELLRLKRKLEAERLRGDPDRVVERVDLLLRAGLGFVGQNRFADVEAVLREAVELIATVDVPVVQAAALDLLGGAILAQERAAEAEEMFRRALALAEEGGATAVAHGRTMSALGRAIMGQGRVAEAEETFRRALALAEEGGATAVERGVMMHELGLVTLAQGRAAEAEAIFRQALALAEEGGAAADVVDVITRGLEAAGRALV